MIKDENYYSSSSLNICKESEKLFYPSIIDEALLTLIGYQVTKKEISAPLDSKKTKGNTSKCLFFFGAQMEKLTNEKYEALEYTIRSKDDGCYLLFKLRVRPDVIDKLKDLFNRSLKPQKNILNLKISKNRDGIKFNEIPIEILIHIAFYLNVKDVLKLELVSKEWNIAMTSNTLWKFIYNDSNLMRKDPISWKNLFIERLRAQNYHSNLRI